ncbi:MAG: hypothetical protein OXC03_05555 [Flavobacteriaceae bacterium]|nr:hypothetical protein [Flavobacteriaceae bacterium]
MIQNINNQQELRTAERVRALQADMYMTTFHGFSGKPIFRGIKKASDLYPLPSDGKNLSELVRARKRSGELNGLKGREAYEALVKMNEKLPDLF